MLLKIIARLLLGTIFYISAIKSLFFNYNGFTKYLESLNIPNPMVIGGIILGFKLIMGILVAVSPIDSITNVAAGSLAIFTAIATVLAHNILIDPSQFNHMLKNVSIIGGLLLLMDN
jgi:uncharacterized membrane protein YphA (DoxX/SURF4 family)